jgi:putative ABC transport system ATP-binding protein
VKDATPSVVPADLVVTHCTKRFQGAGKDVLLAIDDLSLSVPQGQVVALLGSNGAGKSTLLSVIGGNLLPDAGSITIGGEDITLLPSWKRVGKVARVRQNPEQNVFSALTIEENFALALAKLPGRFTLRRAGGKKVRQRAAESLEPFGLGLELRLHALAGTLSGGQRQAVAVAMAMLGRPKVILLDEHVAALDPTSARLVSDETEQLVRSAGITTLMVTHDMAFALERADRLVMLHRGRQVMDIKGEEKAGLDVFGLIGRFEELTGDAIPDRLALS